MARQYPLTLVNVENEPSDDYLEYWLTDNALWYFSDTLYASHGAIVPGKPTRIVTRSLSWDLIYLSNSFLYQMSAGQDLYTGLKIY